LQQREVATALLQDFSLLGEQALLEVAAEAVDLAQSLL
jgi:hypothetical protein